MGSEVLRGYAQEESKLFTTSTGKILFHLLNSVYYQKNVQYTEVKKLEFPFWMNNNLRKYQLISRMDDLFLIITMVVGLLMLILGAFIQAFGVSHRIIPALDINNCVVGQDIYFIYVVILLFVLIITPIALIAVRHVKENYGILSEALYICGINIWFIGMYIVWTGLIYPQYPKIYEAFPPQGWIIIMTIFTFVLNVLLPMKRSYSKSKILLYDREQFNKLLLTQPEEWDIFEAAVIADFKFPLLVFELHMQELLENIYYPSLNNNVMADNYVKGQTYIKYSEVIRLYFCLDSPFCVRRNILIKQLPLSKSWLDEIQQKLASTKVTVGIFDETRNYINDYLFVNTYCRIPEFRIAKDNSGEFLFSRYLSKLQSKVSKSSKEENQSKTPSVNPVRAGESPTDPTFLPEGSDSILSPYSPSIKDIPSPIVTHESMKSDDPEKQNHRESTILNRRSLYPIGMTMNKNSVQLDSLIMPKDESSPSNQHILEDDDYSRIVKVRDSIRNTLSNRNSSILDGSGQATHVMDDNSFTAVNINNPDSQQVQNVESLMNKYKSISYDSSEKRDSLEYATTYSGFFTEGSESAPQSRAISSHYQDSLAIEDIDKRNSSIISFVAPPIGTDITDAELSVQTQSISPLVQNPDEKIRDSNISASARPYFVIEEGDSEE